MHRAHQLPGYSQKALKKVIWTPTARESLRETTNFIGEIWDEHVIDEFLNQLDFRIEQIISNPELAPPFNNSEFRQLYIHKSVSLFYRNYSNYIKILLVWDNRQNPAQLQKKINNANSP
ncbi:type II toxin-antitoxin system RelE/ParE family toxin [Rhodohalobacter sp. SW132]|uniref:type II toxin-antitoxin system RelE/ParE family toxin n=1 Tax=Rhodohalobacter sp. SW132 TaxID=2293433 RepID=UPI000E2875C9|nr:type II toxin-antitoxin system RelE/ParE family toxin [Rhodohalobacter sp. SW132]